MVTWGLLTLSAFDDELPVVYHFPPNPKDFEPFELIPPPLDESESSDSDGSHHIDPQDRVELLRKPDNPARSSHMLHVEQHILQLWAADSPSLRRISLSYGLDPLWQVPSYLPSNGQEYMRPGRHQLYMKNVEGRWDKVDDICSVCPNSRPIGDRANIYDPVVSDKLWGDGNCGHYIRDVSDDRAPESHPFEGPPGVTYWHREWEALPLD